LKIFRASRNLLNSLDLSQNIELEELDISDNNFKWQDLTLLSHLTNLKILNLGNTDVERINNRKFNRFHSSLEFLRDMNKLELIRICNTDIEKGLE